MGEHMSHGDAVRMARAKADSGATLDEIIGWLAASGFNVVGCIQVVMQVGLCSLGDAKQVVYRNPAFAKDRERADALHESIVRAVTEDPPE
jgi:hypothetical protein